MSPDPWRLRCPEGHCSWSVRAHGYYCECCDRQFEYLVDAKHDKRVNRGVV